MNKNPFLRATRRLKLDATMGFRAFSNFNIKDDPLTNWGMEMEMPEWLDDIHNAFEGKRCFLFGTGPSLIDQLPLLSNMNNEYTFTCNRIKLWKELPFTPWLHAVTEPGPFLAWGRAVARTHACPEAKNHVGCCWFPVNIPGWHWLPKAPDDIQARWQGVFGMGDHLPPIPTAWASPLTIAQLALWMGFSELYLLGVDTTQTGQAWDRSKGTTKFPRNIRSIVESADRLRSQVWLNGRKIYDCTPNGRFSQEGVMPYIDLAEVVHATVGVSSN